MLSVQKGLVINPAHSNQEEGTAPCSASPGKPLQRCLVPAPPSATHVPFFCLKTPPQCCCKFPGAKLETLLCRQMLDQSLGVHGLEANMQSSDGHGRVTSAGDSPTWETRGMLHGIFTQRKGM